MKTVLCHFDGSCENNPGGQMGMGYVVFVNQQKIKEESLFIDAGPTNSCNVAEYLAFEYLLNYLISEKLTEENITIIGDSMLVIMQMNAKWKIKNGMYTEHAYRCSNLLDAQFRCNINFKIRWVKRDENAIADLLSRKVPV